MLCWERIINNTANNGPGASYSQAACLLRLELHDFKNQGRLMAQLTLAVNMQWILAF